MLPKSVIIDGCEWKVIVDKRTSGGSFTTGRKEIVVGSYHKNNILKVFLHEVLEAILTEKNMRYDMYGGENNDRRLFSFYHYEFEGLIGEIMTALKGVLKDASNTEANKRKKTKKKAKSKVTSKKAN